ncbi:hypothetical protein C2845_PM01G06770 [Panicum miliaceum]|uniref:F-box associated beta-propeller type 3 domain-containing protein n=1 Tax=Panicum miliaceum TaxID=4540 RepID=A0A3L6TPM6_PANMI|nr:hypothetical protein C2845_PM01G06770 [Panicum miliaceum]
MCDDIVRSIFARLPARTLVASMALSKHRRRMILCPEFRSLHCRLGPPLSRPHIAYITTAQIGRGGYVVSEFHSFHVAGAGLGSGAPARSLTGTGYLGMKYINSCRGVLLLANSGRCMFWNPCCVANNEKKEAIIPGSTRGDCVMGFGYGSRSQTYKLLIARKYAGEQRPQWRTVLSGNRKGESFFYKTYDSSREFFINSLYIDGIIYLLHITKKVLFAFDVDDETVTTINLPGNGYIPDDHLETSRLMEVLGRPCMETGDWNSTTLWMLTVDHQWEQKCVFDKKTNAERGSITGAWDCGGVVVLHTDGSYSHPSRLYLLRPSTTEIFCTNLPCNLKPALMEYAFCWGYKPTLVPPGSVVGELSQEKKKHIMKPLEPLNEQEKRKGQEATLTTVCLMEFLAGVMRRIPENLQQVIEELREGV